jgi:hypothetical protein
MQQDVSRFTLRCSVGDAGAQGIECGRAGLHRAALPGSGLGEGFADAVPLWLGLRTMVDGRPTAVNCRCR